MRRDGARHRYIVRLSDVERRVCTEAIQRLKGSNRKARRALILLQVDEDGPDWPDQQVAAVVGCRVTTVENVRQCCVMQGFEAALNDGRLDPSRRPAKWLDGRQETELIALGRSHAAWSLHLLARRMVELTVGDTISHETADRPPGNDMTGDHLQYWVTPLRGDGEFVVAMDRILRMYEKTHDPQWPVVCMNEQSVQFVRETSTPPEAAEHPRQSDYEYERAGTATVILSCEPLSGWQTVSVGAQRTKLAWAHEVAALLEGRYAACEGVTLLLDNLDTHTPGALYDAFESKRIRARQLVERIRFRYTPRRGSWLNVAQCELSCLTRHWLRGRRVGGPDELRSVVADWSARIRECQCGVNWLMTVADARRQLKSAYPIVST